MDVVGQRENSKGKKKEDRRDQREKEILNE